MPQVCEKCGAATEVGEDFCGQCGTYLEWEERPPEEPEPVVVPEEPAAEAEAASAPSLTERVKAAVGIGQSDEPAPVAGPSEAATGQAPEEAAPAAAAPTPAVAPVQPGVAAPRPAPHRPPPTTKKIEPGDLICGSCGVGNKPDRKFCSRCGHDITEAQVAKVAWYRRIFRRAPTAGQAAGTRPTVKKQRRAPRRLIVLVVVLGVLAGTFVALRPYMNDGWQAILDRVSDPKEFLPADAKAESWRPGHGPAQTIDPESNTYWSPRGDGDGATIRFPMKEPVRLVDLNIFPGVTAEDKELWLDTGRPRVIRAVFVTSSGQEERTLEFGNEMGDKQFHVAISDVESVRLTIERSFSSLNGNGTAIAGVEFYTRK